MAEVLHELVRLSRLDEKLAHLENEAASIPSRREAIATQTAESGARQEALREALQALEAENRQEESALQDAEALLTRLEGQQSQVKTNEAYTALLHEMAAARQSISDHETRILELMDETETARAALAAAETEGKQLVERLAEEARGLDAREEFLAKEVDQLRQARQENTARVERSWLSRYEKVLSRHRPGVAVALNEVCQGCRVGIPPQKFVDLVEGTKLITCEACFRILIHARHLPPGA